MAFVPFVRYGICRWGWVDACKSQEHSGWIIVVGNHAIIKGIETGLSCSGPRVLFCHDALGCQRMLAHRRPGSTRADQISRRRTCAGDPISCNIMHNAACVAWICSFGLGILCGCWSSHTNKLRTLNICISTISGAYSTASSSSSSSVNVIYKVFQLTLP